MARQSFTAVGRLLLLFGTLLIAAVTPYAQARRNADELGLRGYVLAPDGTPVSSGRVMAIRSPASRETTTIDRAGHFRLFPDLAGPYQIVVAAPGFAPYRFIITVPASRAVTLPVIRLSPATYFRARFVTASGEPLTSPTLRRRTVDTRGIQIPDALDGQPTEQIDGDGGITIGPLPWGVTIMAVDIPPFAQTRLKDLVVTGKDPLIDAGVITIQPGTTLQADVVDENGAPVPARDVWIEDAAPRSPLSFRPAKTNQQGRALFDRLAPGRYRLWTQTKEFCGNQNQPLSLARVISVGSNGIQQVRVVVGGRATFRVVSPLGPMNGRTVRATPETNSPAPWQRALFEPSALVRRLPTYLTLAPSCAGTTDADGRVTLRGFPPGPAKVEVRLFNSTYIKRVTVPESGREIAVEVPEGLVSVRVTDQRSNQPVARAEIAWTGNGGRVEAMANANGDALLEAVGTIGGQLSISAPNYQSLEANFQEPPATVQEVALPPEADTRVQIKVVSTSGAALANAVVELAPTNSIDVSDIAITDAKGDVTFLDAPGTSRLTASAEGFVPAMLQVSNDNRDTAVLTLSRGYRVIASAESDVPGQCLVRVFNETGESMDHVLDANSERSFEAPGRISIGPLVPGTYVIELRDGRAPRRERVQIVDRDLFAIFRQP